MNVRMSFQGVKTPVAPKRQAEAKDYDTNKDGYVSDREILKAYGVDFRKKQHAGEDRQGIVHETKCYLAGVPNPYRKEYSSYADVTKDLAKLEKKYPHLCKRVSLGKSVEGRDIWALRLRDGKGERPAVVITGCHHAREWMTVEIPLGMAHALCEGHAAKDPDIQRRLQNSEVWLVPVVNPDGLEISRNKDNMWRKNANAVDLNRNYWDGKAEHYEIYRPASDKPGTTEDDFEEGADDPTSEVYRGPEGASEPETRAMVKLKLGKPNVAGVIDFHSYGESVLHPPGINKKVFKGMKELKDIAERIAPDMKVMKGAEFYPTSGSPDDLQWAYGIPSYTFEVNGCFQPHPSMIEPTVERMNQVGMKFIDEILAREARGARQA